MAAKPFASSADLGVKEQTLEVLADGVYALTAEGDPNVGAIEGEDFLVCFEALATPVAARRWLAKLREHTDKPVRYLVLSHYHAVRVLGASAFDAEIIVSSRADPAPDRRARPAGLGERVRPDAAAVRGARVDPRPHLADDDLPRQAHHRARRRPRRAGAASSCGRGHTEGDIVAWLPKHEILFAGDLVESQAALYTGDAFHFDWAAGTLDRVKALGAAAARSAAAAPIAARPRRRSTPPIEQTRDFLLDHAARRSATCTRAAAPSRTRSTPPTRRWPRSTARWPIFEHCLPFDVQRLWDEFDGIERPVIWTAERDREVWDELQG